MIQGLKIFSLKRSNYLSNTISILSQDTQLMLTDAQLMLMDAQLMLMDTQLMHAVGSAACVRQFENKANSVQLSWSWD